MVYLSGPVEDNFFLLVPFDSGSSNTFMATTSGRGGGRVLPHQRNTNDVVPIIGSALVPSVAASVNNALH